MGKLFFYVLLSLSIVGNSALSEYWLIQEDFIKLGKRDLYQQQKSKDLAQQKKSGEVLCFEDLENPQYVFLFPFKEIASLANYQPIAPKIEKDVLLETSMNFQIFSLHRFLQKCSLKEDSVFAEKKSYFLYALYEIALDNQEVFEGALADAVNKFSKDSVSSWCVFKSLLGGSYPKYLVCLSFATKDELKEWSMDKIIPEIALRDIFRDKKSGWMKKTSF